MYMKRGELIILPHVIALKMSLGDDTMDKFDRNKRSEIMRGVKSKNTKPEIIVRKILHKLGFRFRIHRKDLPGKPDIVLPKYKKVIFIHGCFWHCHEGCKKSQLPTTNKEFWENKIEKNKIRDVENLNRIHALSWEALVIWGCEVSASKRNSLERKLLDYLKN